MIRRYLPVVMIGLMMMTASTSLAVEGVAVPKVLPDRAVDTSSIEGIVKGMCKEGMKPQERFLALYQFYRRMVYHNRYMGGDRRSLLRMINSYGHQLCGSQAATFSVLCRAAGFNTRVAHVSAKGYGGHTVMEVEYGKAWHVVDTMTAFYVLNRKGQIASLAELKADPKLITDAVKEERAPAEWCLCTREVEKEQKGLRKLLHKDAPWSILRWGEGKTLPDFWVNAVAKYRTQEGVYRGHSQPGEMDITLKPNEEYVRLWDNIGLWLTVPSFAKVPPYHTCGHIDEQDTPNFKHFEPYKKTGFKHAKYVYRYYGNGWLEWKPDGTKGEVKAAASKATGLGHDPATGLFKATGGKTVGELVMPVKSPYAVVKIEIDLKIEQADGATTTVSVGDVQVRPGKRRVRFKKVATIAGAKKGVEKIVVDCTKDRAPKYLYDIKVDSRAGVAAFNILRVKTTFQLNTASLPSLYPGDNTVTVSAKAAQKLAGNKLLVTYEWADGKGWKNDHADTQTVTALPYTYKLKADVPAGKMPKMKKLVMKLAPK
jgi:transglutaminase superfamily protein